MRRQTEAFRGLPTSLRSYGRLAMPVRPLTRLLVAGLLGAALLAGDGTILTGRRLQAAEPESPKSPKTPAAETSDPKAPEWKPLFDGKSLGGWKVTEFGGQGDVTVEDGQILLDFGSSMTGITWSKDFPTSNYEIQFDAMRVDGIDFFCGLTFPVKKSYCSLIVGGWGGAVVGLSSIDGKDASENDTTQYMKFDKGRWYAIRLRVTDDRITAWIDDKQVVDQDIQGKKISTRNEVDRSRPLGFSTWETKAALRKIVYRPLKP